MSLSESIKNIELKLEEQVKAEKETITAVALPEAEGIEIMQYIERLRRRSAEIMDAYGG